MSNHPDTSNAHVTIHGKRFRLCTYPTVGGEWGGFVEDQHSYLGATGWEDFTGSRRGQTSRNRALVACVRIALDECATIAADRKQGRT